MRFTPKILNGKGIAWHHVNIIISVSEKLTVVYNTQESVKIIELFFENNRCVNGCGTNRDVQRKCVMELVAKYGWLTEKKSLIRNKRTEEVVVGDVFVKLSIRKLTRVSIEELFMVT